MATREASIKLTLDDGQFASKVRKAGDQVQQIGKKGSRAMKVFGAGIDRVKTQMGSLGGGMRKVIGLAAGFAGAFSAASALKGAVALDARMETLAFRVQTATGELTKAADISDLVGRSAALTARNSDEMAGAFETVFGATKDLEFTKKVMADIGTTATATGEEVADVAVIAQQMSRKFNLSAEQTKNAMAQVFEGAQQGGPSFKDLAGVIDVMGANLIQAGLDGKQGLDFLIGSLNQTDKEMGGLGKQVKGIQQLLVNLGTDTEIRKLSKSLKIDPKTLFNEKDALSRLRVILSQGQKGLDALQANFVGPEEQKALRILFTDPFEKALQRAKAGGLKGKEATEQALRALDGSIASFGKTTLTAADLQKRAAERATEPAARLRVAQEKLTQAFSQPEIIEAVDALAEALPQIASLFGNFVKFAAQNPVLAGTLGIGGIAAKAFVTGMMQSIITAHAMGGNKAAAGITGAMAKGGAGMASKLLAAAPIFAAIAAAGIAGKMAIDSAVEEKGSATGGLAAATAKAASRSGSIARQEKQADELQKAIKRKKAGQGGFMNALFQSDDDEQREQLQIREAEEDLKFKRAHIAKLKASKAAGGGEVKLGEETITAAPSGKPTKVEFADQTPRLIAKAIANELGGMSLRATLDTTSSAGFVGNANIGPGGSRGPSRLPTSSMGGGV